MTIAIDWDVKPQTKQAKKIRPDILGRNCLLRLLVDDKIHHLQVKVSPILNVHGQLSSKSSERAVWELNLHFFKTFICVGQD